MRIAPSSLPRLGMSSCSARRWHSRFGPAALLAHSSDTRAHMLPSHHIIAVIGAVVTSAVPPGMMWLAQLPCGYPGVAASRLGHQRDIRCHTTETLPG